jgi:hypothetical protein
MYPSIELVHAERSGDGIEDAVGVVEGILIYRNEDPSTSVADRSYMQSRNASVLAPSHRATAYRTGTLPADLADPETG